MKRFENERSHTDTSRGIAFLDLVAKVNTTVRETLFLNGEDLRDDVKHNCAGDDSAQAMTELEGDWLAYEDLQLRQYQTTFEVTYADRPTDFD